MSFFTSLQDRTADYVAAVLEKLVSWEVVESRLTKAVQRAAERDGHPMKRILKKQQLAQANSQNRATSRTPQEAR